MEFNGEVILRKVPRDYHVHHELIYVRGVRGINALSFRGVGV